MINNSFINIYFNMQKVRGGISMTDALHGTDRQYSNLAVSQDLIGWRRFMEGMISKEMLVI